MRQEDVRVTAVTAVTETFFSTLRCEACRWWSLSLSLFLTIAYPPKVELSCHSQRRWVLARCLQAEETWDFDWLELNESSIWIINLVSILSRDGESFSENQENHFEGQIMSDHLDSFGSDGSRGTTCLASRWNPPTELFHRERIRHLPCHGLSSNVCKVFHEFQHISTFMS